MDNSLIKRQDAIGAIVNTPTDVYSHDRIVSVLDGAAFRQNEIIDIINALPSEQPERKKGEWILHIDDLFPVESTMECNQCHEHQPVTIDDNYCPNCGADMR